ncbi:MAG: MFS transporter [Verrucomicrobiales bacterium]|nr:MFS transporter [Verrucomicrobiales bacterium]
MKKPSLLVIFLTVFVDLVGFGMVLPLLPKYVRDFGAPGWFLGLVVASYSVMQFLFAPAWGRLSDRIGRRPVLLVSTAGFVASYSLFAIGSGLHDPKAALSIILLSRILSGVCGANITVAQAYIADLSTPEERSKRMGLIGMAFGLGFISGPMIAVGALLWLGLSGPGWFAASICLVNLGLTWFFLGESRKPGTSAARPAGKRFDHWRQVLSRPQIGPLIIIFFFATFAFTCFETTLGLVISQNFAFPPRGPDGEIAISFLFAFSGFIGAAVQGGLIGRLVSALGEPRVIALSLILTAISLAPLPFFVGRMPDSLTALWRDPSVSFFHFSATLLVGGGAPWIGLLGTLAVLAIGSGLTRPPLFGLLSMLASEEEQGFTLGIAQSAGSLARIAGPIFASTTYDWHLSFPYLTCAVIAMACGVWVWTRMPQRIAAGVGARSAPKPS